MNCKNLFEIKNRAQDKNMIQGNTFYHKTNFRILTGRLTRTFFVMTYTLLNDF